MTVQVGVYVPGPTLAAFQAFNAAIAPRKIDQMLTLSNLNEDPVLGAAWASWQATLGAASIMSTMAPYGSTLGAFAAGTYDTAGLYGGTGLAGLAAQCVAHSGPLVIRLAHEFNGDWAPTYGRTHETAASFVAGWRHVVDVFRANGATNVRWCWSPNKWGIPFDHATDPDADDGSGSTWYPGDDYVDTIGIDGYHMADDSEMYTPEDLFLANYTALRAAHPSKEFGIAEFGCSADARLDAFCGGKAGWYTLLAALIRDHMPDTAYCQTWEAAIAPSDWTISSTGSDPAAARAFVDAVTTAPFTQGSGALVHA